MYGKNNSFKSVYDVGMIETAGNKLQDKHMRTIDFACCAGLYYILSL